MTKHISAIASNYVKALRTTTFASNTSLRQNSFIYLQILHSNAYSPYGSLRRKYNERQNVQRTAVCNKPHGSSRLMSQNSRSRLVGLFRTHGMEKNIQKI